MSSYFTDSMTNYANYRRVALGKLVDAKAERDKVYAAAEAAVQADHAAKQAVQKRKVR